MISRTRGDVLHAAGSRYGPTATLKTIHRTLETAKVNEQNFAFIGTPCDVSALRNLAAIDDRVDQYCDCMLTMVCGGFMSPSATYSKLQSYGIDLKDVSAIRYRGHSCPGDTRIELHNGTVHKLSYLEFWGNDESSWELPPRCKICPDGIW